MTDSKTNYKKIYDTWEMSGTFKVNDMKAGPNYSMLIPPPNLTGELHLGHAMQHSILDAIARYRRLKGFNVLLLPGIDHAGIQFEATFNRRLARENLSKRKLGREKWMELAWKYKDEIYHSVSSSWRMMGLSADWSREVFTLDEKPRAAVFESFKTLYDAGLIYRGPYIVQWCPKCNTAIEDLEMEYEQRVEILYTVKYKVNGSNDFIEIATTRPETIFADTAIAIYPKHPKYSRFSRKQVLNPLTGKKIPVIEDKRVEKDFGTGALKITPAHDLLDYEIGTDHDLEIVQTVNKEGRLTQIAKGFEGMKVSEAKLKVVDKLKTLGAMVKEEEYEHSVAVCERCKTIVEPLISEEWFLKMDDLADGALKAIKADKIDFLPKNYKGILIDWLENIHDWCISRSLWWGHRIPVWYKTGSNKRETGNKLAKQEMKVSLESPGKGWVQDEQVLDTWFSSGLWPLSTLGWPKNGNLIKKFFPWNFEISAPEIKYLWIARMIMLSVYFTGEIPFKTMFFHGMLRDIEGRKFSKSLGNGIDPVYLINRWGVDATRMVLYTYSVPGRDGRVSKATLDERAKNYRNFATKIRNIARFIFELKPEGITHSSNVNLNTDDKQIRKDLEATLKKVSINLDSLQLHLAVDELYEFIWHKFADVYIEETKSRRVEAQKTLEYVFLRSIIALAPFMPFLTEELYQTYIATEKSITLEQWPTTGKTKEV